MNLIGLANHTTVFRGSEAVGQGFITRRELFSPAFRRLFQDSYVPSETDITYGLRCIAASLIAPANAVLIGRSAAQIYGLPLAHIYDPVEFAVPQEIRFGPIPGIRVKRTRIPEAEYIEWEHGRVSVPARTGFDLCTRHSPRTDRWNPALRRAVADLDTALRAGLVSLPEMRKFLQGRQGWGIRRARKAVSLADARAESPPESELRVLFAEANLCAVPQVLARDSSGNVYRLDLVIKGTMVAVEYDGREWHDSPQQVSHDNLRRSRLRKSGWTILVVRHEQLRSNPDQIVSMVLAAVREDRARVD